MTTWQLFISTWTWYPSVLVGCASLIVGYLVLVNWRIHRKTGLFVAGIVVVLIALVSPLDVLGDNYLFSAHMVQHLLLLLIAPPLLLLGVPHELARTLVDLRPVGRCEKWLRRPGAAWLIGVGTIWIWHVPLFYNAALASEDIHVLEHLCFLAAATIFWWPILTPLPEARLSPASAMAYLFAAAAASSLLGILLTFAPPGLYPAYLAPQDTHGLLRLIRTSWGISPAADQQIGGLIMWVPGSLVYLFGIMVALNRWFAEPEETDVEHVGAATTNLET
jgi:putative membrane protein